jgi:CelD/BcsL family acetyltransferase involved in cellulose biosynthesis
MREKDQIKRSSDRLLAPFVIEDPRAFAALEDEWEDLYRNSPLATAFQSWAWLYSWWEHYGEGYELRLITLRNNEGLLVGIMPLMLERRRRLGKLLFIGTGQTNYQDLLAREGWEVQVSEAGRRALEQMDGWHVADLQPLRPHGAARDLFEAWAGPRACVWQGNSPVIDVKPWDELLMHLSKNLRSTVRRTLRRAEADGVRCELAGADDAEQAAHRLVALSREQWGERWRETGPEHWTQRFESHLRAAARRMTVRGFGGISEFWREEEVVISNFLVFSKDSVGVYMIGAGQQALQRYQFSSLFIWDGVNIARGRNSKYFDLGAGREPYKLRWMHGTIPLHRMILGRSLLSWSPYAGYRALHSRVKRYLYSEDAPQWLQSAPDIYRRMKYGAARFVKTESTPQWIKSLAANRFKGV